MKKRFFRQYIKLLGKLAKKYIHKHQPYVIGINGSVGKTTCRMIVTQTLQRFVYDKTIYTSSKNYNGDLGFPLSIFQMEDWLPAIDKIISTLFLAIRRTYRGKKPYDIIVLEYGIDYPDEMDFLLSIVKPHIGIFTALDAVHSEQFGDPSKIAHEEIKMIKHTLGVAFLNEADPYAQQLQGMIDIDMFTYQTTDGESEADIHMTNEQLHHDEGNVYATFDLTIKSRTIPVKTNVLSYAHYGYIGVALTVADIVSYQFSSRPVLHALEQFEMIYDLQAGRMTIFPGINDSILVDSSYNAAPLSMRKMIGQSHKIRQSVAPDHALRLVLGDMRELGDFTEQEHRQLAGYVHQAADRIFLVGKEMQQYMHDELMKAGFDASMIHAFDSAVDAADHMRQLMSEGYDKQVILFKGSQNTIFLEEAIKQLLHNKEDIHRLPRQSARRLQQKKKFFGKGKND